VLDYVAYPRLVEWVENLLLGSGDELTVLINNAAVKLSGDSLTEVTRDTMMTELESNAVAPLLIAKVRSTLNITPLLLHLLILFFHYYSYVFPLLLLCYSTVTPLLLHCLCTVSLLLMHC